MSKGNRVVALIVTCSIAFAGLALAQEVPIIPSDQQRIQAIVAFNDGDFEPYGKYLLDMLAWTEYQYRHGNALFNEVKIRNSIIRKAKDQGARLTQAELDEKIDDARRVIESNSLGKQEQYRRSTYDLCLALSRYFSLMSKPDLALRYREKAARFE